VKKVVTIALILVVLLVVVAALGVYFGLNRAVKAGVEGVLPRLTGTKVVLDSANLAPWSGTGELSGFLIGNPEGYDTDHAFKLGRVRVQVDTASVFSDTVIIEEIIVEAPHVIYERSLTLTSSNIAKIQENVDAFAAKHAGEPSEDEPPDDTDQPGKKVVIKRFVMRGGKVSLSAKLLQGRKVSVPLPTIELTDIGKPEEPVTTAEAAKRIFGPIANTVTTVAKTALNQLEKVIRAGKEFVVEAGGKVRVAGSKVIDLTGGGVRKAGEGVRAVGEGAVEKTKDAVGGAVRGVKGLFGRTEEDGETTKPKTGESTPPED
jgi:uncharacterized protein involved in outer membrane biogenesis